MLILSLLLGIVLATCGHGEYTNNNYFYRNAPTFAAVASVSSATTAAQYMTTLAASPKIIPECIDDIFKNVTLDARDDALTEQAKANPNDTLKLISTSIKENKLNPTIKLISLIRDLLSTDTVTLIPGIPGNSKKIICCWLDLSMANYLLKNGIYPETLYDFIESKLPPDSPPIEQLISATPKGNPDFLSLSKLQQLIFKNKEMDSRATQAFSAAKTDVPSEVIQYLYEQYMGHPVPKPTPATT